MAEYITTILFFVLAGALVAPRVHLAWLRSSGVYPKAGNATHSDVQRLLALGRTTLAMRCFRELHGCSLSQAKAAISSMQQEAGIAR